MKINWLFTLIVFSFLTKLPIEAQIDFNSELNRETVNKWHEYITKNAPSDSAYTLVVNWANRHYRVGRYMVARHLFKTYKSLFTERDSLFKVNLDMCTERALASLPKEDTRGLYGEFIEEKAPALEAFIAVKRLAHDYIFRKQWDSAAAVFRHFKPYFPGSQRAFDEITAIIEAPDEGLIVENMGEPLSSTGSEWDPNPTPDGRYIYFSSQHRRGGKGKQDIWFSEKKDGKWQEPVNAGDEINTFNEETIDNVSIDGNTLLMSGEFGGILGQFDICIAERDSSGWSLKRLPAPVNTIHTDESANMTPNKNGVLFTSDRPGGIGPHVPFNRMRYGNIHGNFDIYISFETDSGWSKPINLGPTINTPLAERSAYLHPDGKTIYFSSNGHPGLGGLDVFKSERLSDTSWTQWSKPLNLGKEINSSTDDWGYKILPDGKSAIFAAQGRNDSRGGWDLYTVNLPQSGKPKQMVRIEGHVRTKAGSPVWCEIIWQDLSTGEEIGRVRSDPRDGYYFLALPEGKNYGYFVKKFGYYPTSDNIDLQGKIPENEIKRDIYLVSRHELRSGDEKITLNNLFFEFGEFELKPESRFELDRLSEFLKKTPPKKITVEGHTDEVGPEKDNKVLSEKRALEVKKYISGSGINENIIEYKGFGESKPVVENGGRQEKNRRVEIKLEY